MKCSIPFHRGLVLQSGVFVDGMESSSPSASISSPTLFTGILAANSESQPVACPSCPGLAEPIGAADIFADWSHAIFARLLE